MAYYDPSKGYVGISLSIGRGWVNVQYTINSHPTPVCGWCYVGVGWDRRGEWKPYGVELVALIHSALNPKAGWVVS